MGTKHGSSVSSVIDIGLQLPPAAMGRHRQRDGAPIFAAHRAVGTQRMFSGSAPDAKSVGRTHLDDVLPLNDFLKNLHREKRRSERSGSALSLVLYQANDQTAQDSHHADRLLELLHSAKRETDLLGHLGDGMIAVLCADTGERGITSFMRKVDARAGTLPFSAVASTYPDDLVEQLAKGARTQPAFQPFLVAGESHQGDRAYSLKRCLDFAGALVAICLLGPLMLVAAAVIALTSRGPIIFKQTRLGKGGIPFTFYKFRSMVLNGDDGAHREFVASLIKGDPAQGTEPADKPAPYKLQADPRVTPIGRFIRKTSIDELPQLFNVLNGDMSLVGPRPPIPYEAAHYQPWHLRRIQTVNPGITGVWQVEGRSKVTFNDMVRMDIRYIRDCSLAMDLKILFKTILVVVRGDGAR